MLNASLKAMQPEDFEAQFCDSRETFEALEAYHKLLLKWQKAINLVGPKTLHESWERHFADSAQLLQYIPENTKTLVDIGSGAGFPGLVLAIMRPDIEVHLVESDERKAQFLRTVSRETSVDVTVHNERIESVHFGFQPDLVTARALSELSQLFEYCLPWVVDNPDAAMLFLKGQKAEQEIQEAQKSYRFDLESHKSVTDPAAMILLVTALQRS